MKTKPQTTLSAKTQRELNVLLLRELNVSLKLLSDDINWQASMMPADKHLADLEALRDLTLDAIGRVMKKV